MCILEKRKEDTGLTNRYRKCYSSSLIIREIQIKTTVRYHLTPVRMAIVKETRNNKCGQGCREKEEKKRTMVL